MHTFQYLCKVTIYHPINFNSRITGLDNPNFKKTDIPSITFRFEVLTQAQEKERTVTDNMHNL